MPPFPLSFTSLSQERHHYSDVDYANNRVTDVRGRDQAKRALAAEKGITLVTVPFWWDGRTDRYHHIMTQYPGSNHHSPNHSPKPGSDDQGCATGTARPRSGGIAGHSP